MCNRFDRIHERDRRTDKQTDGQTPNDGIGRACIASRGRNHPMKFGTQQQMWVSVKLEVVDMIIYKPPTALMT